jgi:hypothetical protein
MRAHARMLDFSIGDRVCFESGNHGLIEGILTRYNKRTVTVITDDRRQWNVSPGFLRRAARPSSPSDSGFQLTVGATPKSPVVAIDRRLSACTVPQVAMAFIPVGPNPGFEAKTASRLIVMDKARTSASNSRPWSQASTRPEPCRSRATEIAGNP